MKTLEIYFKDGGWAFQLVVDGSEENGEINNLDDLANLLNLAAGAGLDLGQRLGEVDMCCLPTFGGDEPMDTIGVWSWDADRELVHDGASTYILCSRSALEVRLRDGSGADHELEADDLTEAIAEAEWWIKDGHWDAPSEIEYGICHAGEWLHTGVVRVGPYEQASDDLVTDLLEQSFEAGAKISNGLEAITRWRSEAATAGDLDLVGQIDNLGIENLTAAWDRVSGFPTAECTPHTEEELSKVRRMLNEGTE